MRILSLHTLKKSNNGFIEKKKGWLTIGKQRCYIYLIYTWRTNRVESVKSLFVQRLPYVCRIVFA